MHESVKVISLTPVDREQGMRQLPANSHTYVWVTILQVLIDNTYFVMRMGLCPSHRSRTKQTSLVTFNILICSQERFSMDISNICTFCEKAACWNYQFESSHTLGGGKVRTCFLQNQDFFLKKDVSHAGGW